MVSPGTRRSRRRGLARAPGRCVGCGRRPRRVMSRIPYKWIVAIVFVAGTFMDILDTTSVNVALPTLAEEFDATISQIEWVVLGYLLSLAVWIPASGWIGDRFGTKKIYLFALVMFTGASMLCGIADFPHPAHRVPDPPGCGRRDARAGRHRDALPRVPADRAGQGLDGPHRPDGAGARARARRRRLARHLSLVAVDLLPEPPGRHRDLPDRAVRAQGAQGAVRGPLRPARVRAVGRGARRDPLRARHAARPTDGDRRSC